MNFKLCVFLDIDGVLNSHIYEMKKGLIDEPYVPYYSDIDPERILVLNQLIDREDACIVIHSSWRDTFSLEEFKDFFSYFGVDKDRIVGVTSSNKNKVESIKEYLKENEVIEMIVLEDENIFTLKDDLFGKLYKVGGLGLTLEDLDLIHERLF